MILGEFKPIVGEVFYYVYVKGYGYDKNNKEINVLAFQNGKNFIKHEQVDYTELERRNIISKATNIYQALSWSINDIDGGQTKLF